MENKSQSSIAATYFLDNYPLDILTGKTPPTNKQEELAHEYFFAFSEVLGVFDRLIRYEKYFKEFYPPIESGISPSEAIEYHLRSYLEDFYILQERVRKMTLKLIEDLPSYNIANPSEAEQAISHLSEQIHSKFKKITSGLRRENVHERSVSEIDLVRGKFLNSIMNGEFPLPDNHGLDIDAVKLRHNEVLSSMKTKYVEQAKTNSDSLRKIKEWYSARFAYIFSTLNGHDIEGIEM